MICLKYYTVQSIYVHFMQNLMLVKYKYAKKGNHNIYVYIYIYITLQGCV